MGWMFINKYDGRVDSFIHKKLIFSDIILGLHMLGEICSTPWTQDIKEFLMKAYWNLGKEIVHTTLMHWERLDTVCFKCWSQGPFVWKKSGKTVNWTLVVNYVHPENEPIVYLLQRSSWDVKYRTLSRRGKLGRYFPCYNHYPWLSQGAEYDRGGGKNIFCYWKQLF